MGNILKKYGIWEYILFLIGLVVLSKVTYEFVFDKLEYSMINGVALVVGILLLAAPSTIVDIAKRKAGHKNGKVDE